MYIIFKKTTTCTHTTLCIIWQVLLKSGDSETSTGAKKKRYDYIFFKSWKLCRDVHYIQNDKNMYSYKVCITWLVNSKSKESKTNTGNKKKKSINIKTTKCEQNEAPITLTKIGIVLEEFCTMEKFTVIPTMLPFFRSGVQDKLFHK